MLLVAEDFRANVLNTEKTFSFCFVFVFVFLFLFLFLLFFGSAFDGKIGCITLFDFNPIVASWARPTSVKLATTVCLLSLTLHTQGHLGQTLCNALLNTDRRRF